MMISFIYFLISLVVLSAIVLWLFRRKNISVGIEKSPDKSSEEIHDGSDDKVSEKEEIIHEEIFKTLEKMFPTLSGGVDKTIFFTKIENIIKAKENNRKFLKDVNNNCNTNSEKRKKMVSMLEEMFTSCPDGPERAALYTDVEDILKAMESHVETNVVAPKRDKKKQKKDKPAIPLTEKEKKIAKERSDKAKNKK